MNIMNIATSMNIKNIMTIVGIMDITNIKNTMNNMNMNIMNNRIFLNVIVQMSYPCKHVKVFMSFILCHVIRYLVSQFVF